MRQPAVKAAPPHGSCATRLPLHSTRQPATEAAIPPPEANPNQNQQISRPTTLSTAQPDRGHSSVQGTDPSPPAPSLIRPKKLYTQDSHRCWTPVLQEWIRTLASFNVLSDREQQPLWATRVEPRKHVPPLFEAIKHVKTETGLTWDIATSVRRVLTKEGKVTIATGHGDTYKELETPTKVHGLVGACFSGMWHEPALAKHFLTYVEFNLVATTISTVYNEAAKNAGLLSRMCKFLPTARGEAPPKK